MKDASPEISFMDSLIPSTLPVLTAVIRKTRRIRMGARGALYNEHMHINGQTCVDDKERLPSRFGYR